MVTHHRVWEERESGRAALPAAVQEEELEDDGGGAAAADGFAYGGGRLLEDDEEHGKGRSSGNGGDGVGPEAEGLRPRAAGSGPVGASRGGGAGDGTGGAGAAAGPGAERGTLRVLSRTRSRRRMPAASAAAGGEGREAGIAEEEDGALLLRAASEATLHGRLGDPNPLRVHLSCTNLASSLSPRSPLFYPEVDLRSWDWDFTTYGTEELIKLAYDIFIVSGAVQEFELKPKVLRNFLTAVASHYHAIPYHNFNHACHVLHATYLISSLTRAREVLTPLERFALLLAALCHDLDHDGHSNSYHVNSGSELARIYNDQSVMENHHCAMTFAILDRTDCSLLAGLPAEQQRAVRKAVIAAILCTDMAHHFALTQEFQKHAPAYEPDSEPDRLLLLRVVLHASDIGNAVRPFHVNHAMSRRVHREFEAQAAEEEARGLPVTFAVDTSDHVMCARVELNFLDYVVTTLWERLVDVLPELGPQLGQLRVNRQRYRRMADTGMTAERVLAEEAAQAQHTAADGAVVQADGAAMADAAAAGPSHSPKAVGRPAGGGAADDDGMLVSPGGTRQGGRPNGD